MTLKENHSGKVPLPFVMPSIHAGHSDLPLSMIPKQRSVSRLPHCEVFLLPSTLYSGSTVLMYSLSLKGETCAALPGGRCIQINYLVFFCMEAVSAQLFILAFVCICVDSWMFILCYFILLLRLFQLWPLAHFPVGSCLLQHAPCLWGLFCFLTFCSYEMARLISMFPEPCPRIRYGFQGSRLLITVAIAMGILSPSFLTTSSSSLPFVHGLKDLNLFLFSLYLKMC